ncbi:hypothetical protein ACQP1V_43160 (plasmid) [Microtetraspora malaysiensis]|uniref:hypothetical protein n=1 Tax=Microtetraspora malaysiensis TaxID=161358 RepID=UPI003D8B0A91
MISTIWDALAVIGLITVLATAGAFLLVCRWYHAERRRERRNRDHRARRPAEQVAAELAMFSDFWTDHDLHKTVRTPKEWK